MRWCPESISLMSLFDNLGALRAHSTYLIDCFKMPCAQNCHTFTHYEMVVIIVKNSEKQCQLLTWTWRNRPSQPGMSNGVGVVEKTGSIKCDPALRRKGCSSTSLKLRNELEATLSSKGDKRMEWQDGPVMIRVRLSVPMQKLA